MSTETTTVEIPEGFTEQQVEKLAAIVSATENRTTAFVRQNLASKAEAEALRSLAKLEDIPETLVKENDEITERVTEARKVVFTLANYFSDIASSAEGSMMAQNEVGWATAAVTMAEAGDIDWTPEMVQYVTSIVATYNDTPLPKSVLAATSGKGKGLKPILWECVLCADGKQHGAGDSNILGTQLRNHFTDTHPTVEVENVARLLPSHTIKAKAPGWDGDLFVVDVTGSRIVKVNASATAK